MAHHRRQGHLVVLFRRAPAPAGPSPLVGIDAVEYTTGDPRSAYRASWRRLQSGKVVELTQFLEEQTDPVGLAVVRLRRQPK